MAGNFHSEPKSLVARNRSRRAKPRRKFLNEPSDTEKRTREQGECAGDIHGKEPKGSCHNPVVTD